MVVVTLDNARVVQSILRYLAFKKAHKDIGSVFAASARQFLLMKDNMED